LVQATYEYYEKKSSGNKHPVSYAATPLQEGNEHPATISHSFLVKLFSICNVLVLFLLTLAEKKRSCLWFFTESKEFTEVSAS
jgi:hypothetical protein